MVRQAIHLGLSGICITDHLDYDYPKEPELFLLPLQKYAAEISQLKSNYAGRFPVLLGIELGVQPHLASRHQKIVSEFPFDFVIASSHTADGMDPYYPEYFTGISQKEAYQKYFSAVLKNLSCFSDFDVYGHLDYVTRYGNPAVPADTYPECRQLLDEILKRLIAMGKGIELNTGGLRSCVKRENPHRNILMRYRELGGEIITLGADAHAPEQIAWEFPRAQMLLKECGFTYFENREAKFLPL